MPNIYILLCNRCVYYELCSFFCLYYYGIFVYSSIWLSYFWGNRFIFVARLFGYCTCSYISFCFALCCFVHFLSLLRSESSIARSLLVSSGIIRINAVRCARVVSCRHAEITTELPFLCWCLPMRGEPWSEQTSWRAVSSEMLASNKHRSRRTSKQRVVVFFFLPMLWYEDTDRYNDSHYCDYLFFFIVLLFLLVYCIQSSSSSLFAFAFRVSTYWMYCW